MPFFFLQYPRAAGGYALQMAVSVGLQDMPVLKVMFFDEIIEHFQKAALIELLHVHKAGFGTARMIASGAAK